MIFKHLILWTAYLFAVLLIGYIFFVIKKELATKKRKPSGKKTKQEGSQLEGPVTNGKVFANDKEIKKNVVSQMVGIKDGNVVVAMKCNIK